jgi:cytochrome c biogenesis protein CcmG, thiol:disulfide interchange protein DsbE
MTSRQQWTVVGVVIVVLGLALAFGVHSMHSELFLVGPGSKAPDFKAATLDPTPHPRNLDDYRGQVVLLNVWATWCQPCAVEMPSIERLYNDYAPQGLHVVAVSIDSDGADNAVRAFAKKFGLTFDILRDPAGAIETKYQTTGYPETFIIGRDGVIRKKIIGADDWDSQGNRALINQLLREPAA